MNIEEERERARRLSRRLRERDAEIARLREALKNIYIGGIGERGWTLDEIRAYALNAYSAPTSEGVNYG